MTTAYTSFLPEVLPAVPGCPQILAVDAIRKTAIDFCERGLAWLYNHDPLPSLANEGTYPFEPPTGSLVCEVRQAKYNNIRLIPKTTEQLDEMYQNWQTETGTQPAYYTQIDEDNIILVPMPSSAISDALVMLVALKPTLDSTEVDDRIYQQHLIPISVGAKAKLMMMDGQPWTNEKKAAYLAGVYEEAVSKARYKASSGHGRARRRTRGSYF